MSLFGLLFTTVAYAEVRCDSVDGFNTWMLTHDPTPTVTVSFDVTGVNPADFFGTKGALADLIDSTCTDGASLALKVYGDDDPPNTSHPAGTLKQEYGNACCPGGGCGETWADPNASAEVFDDGSEQCDVMVWIDPISFGYHLDCTSGVFDGVGDNTTYLMPVNYISLLSLSDGSTWYMPNARSTWNEVCWDDGGAGGDPGDTGGGAAGTEELGAIEDATASASSPSGDPDPNDLCVEYGDCEVYLQFDLSAVPGRITSAYLLLQASDDGSAEGSGADAWLVPDNGWDEGSLSWNTRPAATGAALDRVSPVSPGQSYSWDVSAAVSSPGVVSFALLPQSGDTNGVHFLSSEASFTAGPRLQITWEDDGTPTDTGSAGDSEPTGDSTPADDEEPGDAGGDTAAPGEDPTETPVGDDTGFTPDKEEDGAVYGTGCGCDHGATGLGLGPLIALLGGLAGRRRGRRGEAARASGGRAR